MPDILAAGPHIAAALAGGLGCLLAVFVAVLVIVAAAGSRRAAGEPHPEDLDAVERAADQAARLEADQHRRESDSAW